MIEKEPDWQFIVNDIGPSLYRYFCGVVTAPEASDLVQESLIRLVQKYRSGEYQHESGTLKSYAYGIARYVRLEAMKRKEDFVLVDDENDLDIAINKPDGGFEDSVAQLRWAIKLLKPTEQEIILLLIDEDLPLEQIAHQLSLPLGTVKSHIHRAKQKLKQYMEV